MRHTWKFTYTAERVYEAALAQLTYHEERLAFWTKARDKVKAKIREDGIDITESVSEKLSGYANTSASNNWSGPQVNIKPEYLTELHECNNKITARKASVNDYNSWCELLVGAPQTKLLELDQADWLFFFSTK